MSLYDLVSAMAFPKEQPGAVLPAITIVVVDCARYAYAFPVVILVFGLCLLKSRTPRPAVLESIIALAWVFAFCWSFAVIFSWQVSHIRIVN